LDRIWQRVAVYGHQRTFFYGSLLPFKAHLQGTHMWQAAFKVINALIDVAILTSSK
jgi:hypothetical protein